MPTLLLKLLPYWKHLAGLGIAIGYSVFINNWAVSRTNTTWEHREAERVRVELVAKNKALSEASKLKELQDTAAATREAELNKRLQAAERRASTALKDSVNLRRENNVNTKKLEQLQASDPNGPKPLNDGVRNLLTDSQAKVRSRRQP